MIGSDTLCSCESEMATIGCICYRDLLLIGASCLAHHVAHCRSTHYIINLSFAIILRSNPALLIKYLSTNRTPSISRDDSFTYNPIPSCKQQADINLKYENLAFDLALSLSLQGTGIEPDKQRYYRYTTSSDRRYVYDIFSKSLYNDTELNIKFDVIKFRPNGDAYYVMDEEESDSVLLFYKHDILTARTMDIGKFIPGYSQIAFIFHGDYFYSFGATNEIEDEPYYSVSRCGFRRKGSSRRLLDSLSLRFNLNTNRAELLPNMDFEHSDMNVTSLGYKIYIACQDVGYIHVLDTKKLTYHTIQDFKCEHLISADNSKDSEIYAIIGDKIVTYNSKVSKVAQIKLMRLGYRIYNVSISHNGEILYYDYEDNRLAKLNLMNFSRDHKLLSTDHFRKHYGTRYIYTDLNQNSIHGRIDLKNMTSTAMSLDISMQDVDMICELPTGELIVKCSQRYLLYNISTQESRQINTRDYNIDSSYLIPIGYHVYAFTDNYVYRFDVNDCSCVCKKRKSNIFKFKHLSWCVLGHKIYFIGGKSKGIYVYNTMTNKYAVTKIQLPSKYAVSKVIDKRIYVIYMNSYRVYDKNLNLLQKGRSNSRKIGLLPQGSVVLYKDKIYFMNNKSEALEYFDTRNNQRGAEPIQFITKVIS